MAERGTIGVTEVVPAFVARTQFGQILRRVKENRDRFFISRRGKTQAVILSVEDYLWNVVKQPEAITELREIAKEKGLDKLTMDEIDAEIAAFRKGI
jgi:prevent-host-death family protein